MFTFKPREYDANLKDCYVNDESINDIIANEVNLEQSEKHDTSDEAFLAQQIIEADTTLISEEILDGIIRETIKHPFPQRSDHQEDAKRDIGSKYSEKAVFHIKQKEEDSRPVIGLKNTEEQDQSDFSADEIGDEIMMNFNIMRNFEMKRSRAEKNQYDSKVFSMYVKEVFDAILSKEYLFLKAFSKPIQKDYLECLTKLHYHGIAEEYQEDIDNSMLNDIDDQSSILTIDLYLSLEKKREEENDRLRKLDVDEILSSKMPSNLFKPSKGKYDKTHIKNKLSLFTE